VITFSTSPMPRERARSRSKRSGFNTILRLLEHIVEFMEENSLQDGTAYIALGNGTPELYMVTRSEAYDFELGDRLSEFAAPYIERGLLGSAVLIPASSPEELAAYFDLNKVIRIERVH
jgi:hypothetical protein